ncbi:pyridoxamine 5'-phosphate oxidase family protein [Methanobacterium alkalithermotolerans]|uniref:Pyridoxamine 5'-phosphate oxidase family protein n=1 Tax=Methanobacterium alkalithermotolerans TaxID=2731220 RepID=A0A8T8K4V1_9EURY|nr:pyridoxamine 5'-phosphate oxidase family protein [Methanobacterium alkalithermotolerans]QUH22505.1 pyridoxamine 5'-phosphate oxidase family protein [Methanobacterium alkalithermotolerans]RJS49436.1 MAG: flavin-nucleotide-binding protein [Methanobacterium sp.]
MVLNEEMMEAIEKNLVFLATVSKEGVPNVVPIGFARPLNENTILIADNYMNKTIKNLEDNHKLSLIVQDAKSLPYQFKGTVEIFKSGEYFDEVVDWAQNVMSELEPKSAILFTVEDIYSVKPGPEAGKKIA